MRLLLALLAALALSAASARAQDTADDLAVIIANKSYKHAAEVKFALRDAEAFAKAATEALDVPRSRVRPILRDLTSFELRRLFAKDGEIAGLMRGRRPTARLIVFYSGHGVPVDGRGHLLPVDAPPGAAGDAAYDIEQMKSDLVAIKPERGQVLVFLDACFSGQTGAGAPLVPGSSKGPIDIAAMSAKRKDVVVVAAAQHAQVAWWDEAADRQHGLFTDTLIDGLYGLASEDGKQLTVASLERFLNQRMSERLAVVRPGHTQTPDVAALDRGMVIATYPKGPGVRDVKLAALEKRQCQLLQGETDPERIETFTERECRICACRPALRDLARDLRRRQAETAAACAAEQKLWPSYRSGDAARIELFLKAVTCPAVIAEAKAALAAKTAPAPPKSSEPAPKIVMIDPKRPAAGADTGAGSSPGGPAQRRAVRIGTAGTGGSFYPVGALIASVVSGPGIDASAIVTSDTSFNIGAVLQGNLEAAFGMADAITTAHAKGGPTSRSPGSDLRLIASLYDTTQLFTSAKQPDDLIYELTRALWADKARAAFGSGPEKARLIRRETALAGLAIPLHPGAERFYREVGMLAASPEASPVGSAPAPKVAAIEPPRPAAGAGPAGDPALSVVPGSGKSFRDKLANGQACAFCPEMVVVPAGSFLMGSPAGEQGRDDNEGPQREVTIRQPFAVGKFEVTFKEWDACVAAGGCIHRPNDEGWGRGRQPAINLSLQDAQQHAAWLAGITGKEYRFLTEAEWEYAARGGAKSRYSLPDRKENLDLYAWFNQNSKNRAHLVGSKRANTWGLFDMHGNVWEWVADRWNVSYSGAPKDGSSWRTGDCNRGVLRGGSWTNHQLDVRSARRAVNVINFRLHIYGFRVARTITP